MTVASLGRLVAAVAAALATLALQGTGLGAQPAAPGTTGNEPAAALRARAAQVAGVVAADTAALERLGRRYVAEQAALTAAHLAARRLAAAATRASAGIHTDTLVLRRAAINAYVSSGSTTTIGLALEERLGQLAVSRAYLDVAASHLDEAVARLAAERRALQRELAGQRRAAASARRALAAVGKARAGAVAAYDDEGRLLASLHGQLARLVAEQAAARQAAARARRAAAERRAEAQAAAAQAARARAEAAAKALPATTLPVTAPAGPAPAGPAPATTAPAGGAATTGAAGGTPAASGPPVPSASPAPSVVPSSIATDMAGLRKCESGDDYSLDTGNGYYGAYQFSLSTWLSLGESGLPSSAPPSVQDATAYRLYKEVGWSAWPACSALLGL